MCWIVLPHNRFEFHLNSEGETIDPELEKKYFKHAGQILAEICEICSGMIIDGHPVFAEYINVEEKEEY